jgi:hypothetical protein
MIIQYPAIIVSHSSLPDAKQFQVLLGGEFSPCGNDIPLQTGMGWVFVEVHPTSFRKPYPS